jgi:hypothetical protein
VSVTKDTVSVPEVPEIPKVVEIDWKDTAPLPFVIRACPEVPSVRGSAYPVLATFPKCSALLKIIFSAELVVTNVM